MNTFHVGKFKGILQTLDSVTNKSLEIIIKNSYKDADKSLLLSMKRTETGVQFLKYNIEIEQVVFIDKPKRYYHINSNATEQRLYSNITLFESAVAIIKSLTYKSDLLGAQRIFKLDERYDRLLVDSIFHRHHMQNAADIRQYELYQTRFKQTYAKAKQIRRELKAYF